MAFFCVHKNNVQGPQGQGLVCESLTENQKYDFQKEKTKGLFLKEWYKLLFSSTILAKQDLKCRIKNNHTCRGPQKILQFLGD